MAVNKWEGTVNAEWGLLTNWSKGSVPVAEDDVTFGSGKPSCTISATAECRSLVFESGYNKTFKINTGITLKIGSTASNGGVCLKLNSEMTVTFSGGPIIDFVAAHATVEEITTAGKTLPNLTFNPAVSTNGSYKFVDKVELSTTSQGIVFTKGAELNTNNQEVVAGSLEVAESNKLKAGTSTIKLNGISGAILKFGAVHGNSAIGSATFEFVGTGSSVKKVKPVSAETEFGTIVIACEGLNFEENLFVKKLKLKTKGKTTAATKFPKSGKVTVTEEFTSDSTSGAESLIETTLAEKACEFKYENGTLEALDWLKLVDVKAADSTHYYAGANSTLTRSENWKKEAAPAVGGTNPLVMLV